MNVNSIFLDPKTLEETGGHYGVVSGNMSTMGMQQRFTEQYVNKLELVNEIQQHLNLHAQTLCDLPQEADREPATEVWKAIKYLLDQVKAL